MEKLYYIIYEGRITALTQLCQTMMRKKSTSFMRKSPYVVKNGNARYVEYIPALSSNTIRKMMRVHIASDIVTSLDKKLGYDPLILLYQGGGGKTKKKEGDGNGTGVSGIVRAEKMKETNIVLSLFGGSLSDGTISNGKTIVNEPILLCNETVNSVLPLFPKDIDVSDYAELYAKKLYTLAQFTRVDVCKNPQIFGQLDEDGIAEMMAVDEDATKASAKRKRKSEKSKSTAQETSAEEDDETEEGGPTKRQMIYASEVLAAGSEMYSSMIFKNPTDIEIGATLGALRRFSRLPYIAAQSAKGMGLIALDLKARDSERNSLGEIKVDGRGGFALNGSALEKCLEAYDKYLNDIRESKVVVQL